MIDEEKISHFLSEYKLICEKYQLEVFSCGCCDSPWVQQVHNLEAHIEHLKEHFDISSLPPS